MAENNTYLRGFLPYALAALLVGLVGGFVTVLGPAFVRDLGLPYNNTTWTALAMAMSTAACAPILGKLGDVIGRKRTLLLGIVVFTAGNALSAVAGSLLFMLLARFITGIGTAAIAPVILAYIVTEFPREAMAKGFSLYMLISSAAVIFGPTLGGVILEFYSWRTLLWVCTALSAVIFVLCFLTLGKTPARRGSLAGFDFAGAGAVLIFFSLLLCVPSFGQNFGWNSVQFLAVLLAAIASLGVLILAERRAAQPILRGSFLARRAFLLSVAALFLTQGLMQANMTNTIVFVNYTQPDNTLISGYAISIMYIGMSLGSVLIGPLADRFEPKNVLTASLLLTGIGCALMLLFDTAASFVLLALSLGVLGFGLGGNAAIFLKVALYGVPQEQAGAGTGTYGLFRDLAAPFGVAVFVPLFTNRIAADAAAGISGAAAAVDAMHMLALAEIACVAAGVAAVRFLPKIHREGNK